MEKITYASLGSLGESFHQEFESAMDRVRKELGCEHPIFINGKPQRSREGTFPDVSPADRRIILGKFQKGNRDDARRAVAAAKKAFPAWKATPWQQRVALLRKVAGLIVENECELAALLSMEVGKNRFEAIAEVSESADLILYYCLRMEERQGYEIPMSRAEKEMTDSVLKPYGVWVVIAPFNFPLALAAGMAAGALLGGNTVVFKPASDTPWSGVRLFELMRDAGLPSGVFHLVTGLGDRVGREFIENPEVDGMVFTGSREVGIHLLRSFSEKRPRPCIAEMGGKNAAIIMPSADLDDAAEGVMRSAFGMGGEKCSACSRVYAHRDVYKTFLERLVEKTRAIKIGDPLKRDTFLGPLINERAVRKFEHAVRLGRKEGRVVDGGRVWDKDEFEHGCFVQPTIVDRLPWDSKMFCEEFFAPILAVATVKNLEEAVNRANQSEYGLTAGIFTSEEKEQRQFFDQIEVGVAYCNRRGGATTGAWPGIQSFGGWKGSGSSGKNALGPHYVAQFMREQSQTVMKKW